jgi:hypothetical protein
MISGLAVLSKGSFKLLLSGRESCGGVSEEVVIGGWSGELILWDGRLSGDCGKEALSEFVVFWVRLYEIKL